MAYWSIVVFLAAGMFSKGITAIDTKSPLSRLSAQSCLSCHSEIAAEWQHSRHAKAWSNPIFQSEYRKRHLVWCRNCHAPLVEQQIEITNPKATRTSLLSEGVNCAVCHIRNGRIHAAKRRPGSPHNTRVVKGFGDAKYCGGCHEFSFPVIHSNGQFVRYTTEPMQATVSQFLAAKSMINATSCGDCHGQSPAKHVYPGAHDMVMLRKAVTLNVCRTRGLVVATVTNQGAGHNVPTGDVHRHLIGRIWVSQAPEFVKELFIGRRFRPNPLGGKLTTWDSTLAPKTSKSLRVSVVSLVPASFPNRNNPIVNVSLRYVYATEEHPAKPFGNDPAFRTIDRKRMRFHAISQCL